MMLLTKKIKATLPPLYGQEKELDPVAYVKFFSPSGRGTWYGLEFDGKDRFFGWVASPLGADCDELGYFSLAELKAVRCPIRLGGRTIGHLPIERDYYFKPTQLSVVKQLHQHSPSASSGVQAEGCYGKAQASTKATGR